VNRFKGLAATLAAALLVVPSAFAESRHSNETHETHHDRGSSHQSSGSHSWDRSQTHSSDRGHNGGTSERNFDRSRTFNNERSFDRSRTFNNDRSSRDNRSFDRERGRTENFRDNRSFDRGRSFDHGRSFDRGRGFERHDGDRGRAFFHEGRVSRFEHWNGGYRVWLIGAPYPFFIPEARFRLFPHFGVGLSIRLGGYWNPLGYYDYYDAPYDGSYYDGYSSPAYVRGDLTGIVESVDYRRGTVLVRDRASDRIVNVVMRGDDPRFGELRIGDYVELSGDWTRIGTFDAYRVYNQDSAGYRYYER